MLASAPELIDPRVTVREAPASRVAVIRCSGFWSEAHCAKYLARLRFVLKARG